MIKLKQILEANLPKKKINKAKEAKLLYVKDKDGKYIITPKTLKNFFDVHPHQGVNPEIAKNFMKYFDFYAYNQFAETDPLTNIEDDYHTIMNDYLDTYRRW